MFSILKFGANDWWTFKQGKYYDCWTGFGRLHFVNFVCIPFHTAVSFKSLNSWRLYCWGFNGLLLCCRDVLDTNEQSFRKIYVLNQLKQEQRNSVIMQQQKQQNLYSVDTNFYSIIVERSDNGTILLILWAHIK